MAILVFGSLAFDRIMSFPGTFSDSILPESLSRLNVSFLIDDLVERRGGTAGNIAYGLGLMGERPRIVASAGRDFAEYGAALERLGLPLDGIRIVPEAFTAACFLITDKGHNQINAFHPAAMKESARWDGQAADWAIISPGNMDDMRELPGRFRTAKIPYLYDPGQQIPALAALASDGQVLLEGIAGSAFFISNDYELELVLKITGKTQAEIRALCGGIITTLGEKGATLLDGGGVTQVDVARPDCVNDPTGAGDSFRSGLLKGLAHGLAPVDCARLGAVSASFCVEKHGTQEHSFSFESFAARYRATFGREPGLSW